VSTAELAVYRSLRQNLFMARRECRHCKTWIEPGEAHDCWTTTEAALTRDLRVDLREAWERLRETAANFGQQRIYASGHAIMFARKTCYFFVRPKKQFLEVCVFLDRAIEASHVRRVDRVSKSKFVNIIRITHRDEIEAPVTDWLREAYEMSNALSKGNAALKTNSKPGQDRDGSGRLKMAEKGALGVQRPAVRRDEGKQLRRVRLICSLIPGAMEKISHGAPTFFTPKRVFAMFANNHHGDGHIAVWVPAAPGVQADLIEEEPDTYFRPPYVGGAGWVGVELSKVDDERLGAVIRESFRLMTMKTNATSPSKSPRSRRPGNAPRGPG
jgi:hypothetical protein